VHSTSLFSELTHQGFEHVEQVGLWRKVANVATTLRGLVGRFGEFVALIPMEAISIDYDMSGLEPLQHVSYRAGYNWATGTG
jgi:hypothetical protein